METPRRDDVGRVVGLWLAGWRWGEGGGIRAPRGARVSHPTGLVCCKGGRAWIPGCAGRRGERFRRREAPMETPRRDDVGRVVGL
jgi:hypothetical protein